MTALIRSLASLNVSAKYVQIRPGKSRLGQAKPDHKSLAAEPTVKSASSSDIEPQNSLLQLVSYCTVQSKARNRTLTLMLALAL